MDSWGDEVKREETDSVPRHIKARLAAAQQVKARLPKRITLPKPPPLPRRNELARTLRPLSELAEFVGEIAPA